VTVTNITKAIQFTPILAAAHMRDIAFFDVGQPASPALADLAESGNVMPLKTMLDGSDKVTGTAMTAGLLDAGASVTFDINLDQRVGRISLAAMLLPTNDSFVALNSVYLPRRGEGSVTYAADAYDAGSEPNDELCGSIPGPLCMGEGRSPIDNDAEGFVHMSNGIHGIGDLAPATYDWRGAVAEVTIQRVRN
jgi:hypothetical protein